MQILVERTRSKLSAVMPLGRPVYFPSPSASDPSTNSITLVLITIASKYGLGAETALTIAPAKPKQILLAGRDESKITPVIEKIKKIQPSIEVVFIKVDLLNNASVHQAVERIKETTDKLRYLIEQCRNHGAQGLRNFQ